MATKEPEGESPKTPEEKTPERQAVVGTVVPDKNGLRELRVEIAQPRPRTGGGAFLERVVAIFRPSPEQDRVGEALNQAEENYKLYRIEKRLEEEKLRVDLYSERRVKSFAVEAEIDRAQHNLSRSQARQDAVTQIDAERTKVLSDLGKRLEEEQKALKTRFTELLNDAIERRKAALSGSGDIDAEYRDKDYFDDLIRALSRQYDKECLDLTDTFGKQRAETNKRFNERQLALEG